MRDTIHRVNARAAGYVLAGALSFGACGGPMAEGVRPTPPAPQQSSSASGQEIGPVTIVPRVSASDPLANAQPSYQAPVPQAAVDPFAMDSRMQEIVSSLSGDSNAVV